MKLNQWRDHYIMIYESSMRVYEGTNKDKVTALAAAEEALFWGLNVEQEKGNLLVWPSPIKEDFMLFCFMWSLKTGIIPDYKISNSLQEKEHKFWWLHYLLNHPS